MSPHAGNLCREQILHFRQGSNRAPTGRRCATLGKQIRSVLAHLPDTPATKMTIFCPVDRPGSQSVPLTDGAALHMHAPVRCSHGPGGHAAERCTHYKTVQFVVTVDIKFTQKDMAATIQRLWFFVGHHTDGVYPVRR